MWISCFGVRNRTSRAVWVVCGLMLGVVGCSADDKPSENGGSPAVVPPAGDAGAIPGSSTANPGTSGMQPADAGGGVSPGMTANPGTNPGRDASPGPVLSGADAAPAVDSGGQTSPGPTIAADSGATDADGPVSDGGPTTPLDYSKPGPHKVVTEKNVGKDFRNTNVQDETATCRAFVSIIQLPGEGNVDEELTNYPADMDRQLYTLFRPATLEEGVKYPVITWGNGTCAQPLLYSEILEHLASWGFLVIATNATSVGSGMEMQRGIDYLLKENETQGSPLFGHVETSMLGASGHSQGSQGTLAVGGNARIKVTVPIQGAGASGVRALKGPTFLISGEKDTLATPSSIESAFGSATVPAVYGMSVGQDHLMPGRMPAPILKGVTAWFRIHLSKDDAARPAFYGSACELCSDPTWKITRKNL